MACSATGNVADAGLAVGGLQSSDTDSVFDDQVIAQRILVSETLAVNFDGTCIGRGPVAHIEDLVARSKIFAGIAMAPEAPLHLQRLLLIHQWHGVDRAMTGVAAHPLRDVNAVIKEDEVGKLIDARPLQRFTGSIAGSNGLKQRRIGPDLGVAVHAGFRWRDSGVAGGFHRSVTVAAIDAESGDVMLVAEGNGLRLANASIGHVRRTLNGVTDPD